MENQEGSTYKVPYTTILEINPHTNPKVERLEVATIYGFQVIVGKNQFKVGDKVIYIPVDSILPLNIEEILVPKDAKIPLHKSRIRQIRIQGLASQGMAVHPLQLRSVINLDRITVETDLKDYLGITKYEPPAPATQGVNFGKKNRGKKTDNPLFHKYNGLSNIKWFPNMFKDGDEVVIQEKLHGTNARAGKMPFAATTLWKKIQKFLHIAPRYENCYGSNNVEISASYSYKGYYGEDVYGKVFEKIDIFSKLKEGDTVFGEIVGPGIQKGYSYSLKEHEFVVFDAKILQEDGTQRWLNPAEVKAFSIERGLQFVPVLYEGPFNKELTYALSKGPSMFDENEKVREGIVIKAAENYSIEGNKQALKLVSEEYLDNKENTDFH